MYPVLFRVSGYPIYSYTLLLDLGLLLGLLVAWWQARRLDALSDPGAVVDSAFWGVIGGVLGGRAGLPALRWARFLIGSAAFYLGWGTVLSLTAR